MKRVQKEPELDLNSQKRFIHVIELQQPNPLSPPSHYPDLLSSLDDTLLLFDAYLLSLEVHHRPLSYSATIVASNTNAKLIESVLNPPPSESHPSFEEQFGNPGF